MLIVLFYYVSSSFNYWLKLLYNFLSLLPNSQYIQEVPAKEAKAEIETHPLTVEAKIVRCPIFGLFF